METKPPIKPGFSDKSNFAGIPQTYQPITPQPGKSDQLPHTALFSTLPPPPTSPKGIPFPLFVIFIFVAFISGLFLASWYFQAQPKPAPEQTRTVPPVAQTLIVGTDATNFPMAYGTKEGGVAGYDVDLAYRLANEIGTTVQFKNVPRNTLLAELTGKKIDLVISSFTITDKLKEQYAFSEPYFDTGEVIVSPKSTPLASTAELKDKKIAVQKGTASEDEARTYTASELVTSFENLEDAAKAVVDGTVDALLADQTLVKDILTRYDALQVSAPVTEEQYGIVARKDQTELLGKINQAVKKFKTEGTLPSLQEKWMK